jgi:hypothetical protein
MAPNQKHRKNSPNATDDASLWVTQPNKRYLPLTLLSAQGKSTATATVIEQDKEAAELLEEKLSQKALGKHDEYWHWPTLASDSVVSKNRSNKTGQETSKSSKIDLFSAAFIESRLLAESQRLQERLQKGVTIIRAPPIPTDDIANWLERSDKVTCEANRTLSERTGYWDWAPGAKEDQAPIIQLLLKEEIARQHVSAETMERRLLQDRRIAEEECPAKIRRTTLNVEEDEAYWWWDSSPPITVYADPATVDDSYWEWNTDMGIKSVSSDTLAGILEHAAARELFSIQHLTKRRVQAASKAKVGSKCMAASPEASDDYLACSSN